MAAPAEQWTIGKLLETASSYLSEKGSASARLDAELLLAETLGLERIELYTQFDRPLSPSEVAAYRALVARRAAREPVAYILGRAYFRHLVLEVGPAVLIPRPETEELVEVALSLLRRRPLLDGLDRTDSTSTSELDTQPLVADVGTGSGAIALSLAQEAGVRVLAIDTSPAALAVAEANAKKLGLEDSVELSLSDLLAGVSDSSLHLVVSNPPYVASDDMGTLEPDIRLYEPVAALEAGPDGLAVIARLLKEAVRVLGPGGSLLLEVGDRQATEVEGLARDAGFALVDVHKDMSGKDRIVEATMPGAATLRIDGSDERQFAAVRSALQESAIVGVPTDTVYGLAARWDSAAGVRALFLAKGRAQEQTVAVLFASVDEVERALPHLDPMACRVMRGLLPGPYTFVVTTEVPRAPLVGTADSLGVRVPDAPGLLSLIASLGTPLAATSANLTGGRDAATLKDVAPAVLAHCSVAFDAASSADRGGGPGGGAGTGQIAGLASTVVDLRPLSDGGPPVVLRVGAVPEKQVLESIAALA